MTVICAGDKSRIWSTQIMAFDLNGTIGPILDGVIELMPSFLALVIAVVPVIITLSVVGFIVKFWDKILTMLNI